MRRLMLTGESTILRAPVPADGPCLFELRNNFALQSTMLSLPRANSPRRVEDWLERVLTDSHSLFFIIAQREGGRPIGFILLREMDFVHGHGRLGICLEESAQGKGHAREALALLERHAREVFRIRKVLLDVLAANERAVAVYEKAGYQRVGLLRAQFYHAGAYHDVLVMEHVL